MSNRVRVLCSHPDHGPFMGGRALRLVEQRFEAAQLRRANKYLLPADFSAWPRWKRCLYMAKKMSGAWRFQIFREPRGTNAKKAAFWRAAEAMGFQRPKRRDKPKAAYRIQFVARPRQQGRRANMPHDPRQDGPEHVQPAEPRDPRVRGLAEILNDMNANPHWADPVRPAQEAVAAIRGARNQAVGDPIAFAAWDDVAEGV